MVIDYTGKIGYISYIGYKVKIGYRLCRLCGQDMLYRLYRLLSYIGNIAYKSFIG